MSEDRESYMNAEAIDGYAEALAELERRVAELEEVFGQLDSIIVVPMGSASEGLMIALGEVFEMDIQMGVGRDSVVRGVGPHAGLIGAVLRAAIAVEGGEK